MISARAPAKINLTLEVLRKREDGYHEIRSVVQTIDFADVLRFEEDTRLEFHCSLPGWSSGKSLVSKAAELLQSHSGRRLGARIEIEKRVPLLAGLGGDSSDAAAVLQGLNLLWNLQLSLRDLIALGGSLGSDVPLFLYGGTLLLEGRGEKVQPLPPMPHMSVVLLRPASPSVENKTRQMYARLSPADYSNGAATEALVAKLRNSELSLEDGLYNVFDQVGMRFYSRLREARSKFLEAGAGSVHLAGSGPTLFSLVKDSQTASRIQESLQAAGHESYLADF